MGIGDFQILSIFILTLPCFTLLVLSCQIFELICEWVLEVASMVFMLLCLRDSESKALEKCDCLSPWVLMVWIRCLQTLYLQLQNKGETLLADNSFLWINFMVWHKKFWIGKLFKSHLPHQFSSLPTPCPLDRSYGSENK